MQKLAEVVGGGKGYASACLSVIRIVSRAIETPVTRSYGKKAWDLMISEGVLRPVEGGYSSKDWLKENGFFDPRGKLERKNTQSARIPTESKPNNEPVTDLTDEQNRANLKKFLSMLG